MYYWSPKPKERKANLVGKMVRISKKRREDLLSGKRKPTSYLDLAVLNPEIVQIISEKLIRQEIING